MEQVAHEQTIGGYRLAGGRANCVLFLFVGQMFGRNGLAERNFIEKERERESWIVLCLASDCFFFEEAAQRRNGPTSF